MKEDRILTASAEDRMNQCEDQYMVTRTDFLDSHQRRLVEEMIRQTPHSCRIVFYGGYDECERSFCAFLPDYASPDDCADELAVVRVTVSEAGRKLTHRDYLGSLLGLGIKREKTGDILTRDSGADIIILKELADFIELNYTHAGRTPLKVEILPLSELSVPEAVFAVKTDTVASMRLDGIVSSVFGISRSRAAEAVRKGIVFVNSAECLKPDREVEEGDKIVLRGKGKAYLSSIGGMSRKGRIYVEYRVYR